MIDRTADAINVKILEQYTLVDGHVHLWFKFKNDNLSLIKQRLVNLEWGMAQFPINLYLNNLCASYDTFIVI